MSQMNIPDEPNTLVYVHIGKCGGSSLWLALQDSSIIAQEFRHVALVHVEKPPILHSARYLIVIRNPIGRALSAFNWRYKLVVEDATQKDRFEGEYEILKTYGSLNTLAEALYDSDQNLNMQAAHDFRAIHHLKEDIAFYLTELLSVISPTQLYAVFTAENLNADIAQHLGVEQVKTVNANKEMTPQDKLILSQTARANLRCFLSDDYAAVEKLCHIPDLLTPPHADLLV